MWNDVENMEERQGRIVKWYGKYGRKVGSTLKWYGKSAREVDCIVKWYE